VSDERNSGLGPDGRQRLGSNVKVRRLRADFSRGGLGASAAVSTHTLGQIEGGRSLATLDIWVRLAGTLPASLDELLEGVTWKPSPFEEEHGEGAYIAKQRRTDGDGR